MSAYPNQEVNFVLLLIYLPISSLATIDLEDRNNQDEYRIDLWQVINDLKDEKEIS
jgi:hypothetical protein